MTTIADVEAFFRGLTSDWIAKAVTITNDDPALFEKAEKLAAHMAAGYMAYYEDQGYTIQDFATMSVPGYGVWFKFRKVR